MRDWIIHAWNRNPDDGNGDGDNDDDDDGDGDGTGLVSIRTGMAQRTTQRFGTNGTHKQQSFTRNQHARSLFRKQHLGMLRRMRRSCMLSGSSPTPSSGTRRNLRMQRHAWDVSESWTAVVFGSPELPVGTRSVSGRARDPIPKATAIIGPLRDDCRTWKS